MSFSARTDPVLEIRPASAFLGFLAALANVTAPRGACWAEAEAALSEGEANIDRGIEAITQMITDTRVAAERGEQVDWDRLIDRLEFYETEAGGDLSQIHKLADRILVLIGGAVAGAKSRAHPMARRQENAVARFVEALRDARWQAMAHRAHFDPDSHRGATFNNAEELKRYLANV
jgi:hypothetical protein